MPPNRVHLGIDLGAESGRVIAGLWNGTSIRLEEIHRFPNRPIRLAGTLRWDILRLWSEIQQGLTMAGAKYGAKIASVGVDAWAIDYVLLTDKNEILGQPWHYRDARTNGMMAKAFGKMPRAEIFSRTGLQFIQINTLYQLLALKERRPDLLDAADCLLMIPDFFHWALCGARVVEYTNGSTTQCMDPVSRNWSFGLLKKFGLPTRIFPKVAPPCAKLGVLRKSVAEQTGLGRVQVIAPPSHDTAAAVAGVPTTSTGKSNWAYISSGTWSLMGVEVRKAVLSDCARELNMTNEGGIDDTVRLLKNIMGLWLVQQCRRAFEARGAHVTYARLARDAARAPALRSVVDVNDPRFFNPPDMPAAIRDFCRETRQPIPKSEGELVRCTYESLALKYREVLGQLEEVTGGRIAVIHIVGGGSQSAILNQFTADACERPVIAGPVEAAALGNVLSQVRATGGLGSLAEMREVVRKSSDLKHYATGNATPWRAAAHRLASFPPQK